MRHRIAIAIACTLLLGGCRGMREASSIGPEVEPSAAAPQTTATGQPANTTPAPQPQRQYTVMNFNAEAEGISATGQMRVAQDSAIWVAVYKIVELGRAMATRDSVWLNVPFLGRYFAGTYAELSATLKRPVSYEQLQAMALADNAEEQVARLAAELGLSASVAITDRRRVQWLNMPFRKNQ